MHVIFASIAHPPLVWIQSQCMLPSEHATSFHIPQSFRNAYRPEHSGQGRAPRIGVWSGGDMASSMEDVAGAASKREL